MLQLIQVTAQYSNAVLLAIMPQVTDFVKNLDLRMPSPIVSQVAEFRCWPVADDIGGAIVLNNGSWIWYHRGYVNGFRTSHSYYHLQDPSEIPKYFGELRFTQEEALQLARSNIAKLGRSLRETFADQVPEIESPPKIGTNVVPHYRFTWGDPVFQGGSTRVEINAEKGIPEEIRLASPFFWREPPKLDVSPPLLNQDTRPIAFESNHLMTVALGKVKDYAAKLQLPIKPPLSLAQVERFQIISPDSTRLKLTNSCWFTIQHDDVVEFSTPDSVYGRDPSDRPRPIEEYLGKWNINEEEASQLVRGAIRQLGRQPEDFNAVGRPLVTKPRRIGNYVVPRYCLRWLTNDPRTGGTIALVYAEVDANKKKIVWLQLVGGRVRSGGSDWRGWRPKTNNIARLPMIYTPPEDGANEQSVEYLRKTMGYKTGESNPTNIKPENPYE